MNNLIREGRRSQHNLSIDLSQYCLENPITKSHSQKLLNDLKSPSLKLPSLDIRTQKFLMQRDLDLQR